MRLTTIRFQQPLRPFNRATPKFGICFGGRRSVLSNGLKRRARQCPEHRRFLHQRIAG